MDILKGKGNVTSLTFSSKYMNRYLYSGHGYSLAQLMIERLCDVSISNLAQNLIFEPLGMNRSSFSLSALDANYSIGGLKTGGSVEHKYPEYAAAGLWTTPMDLLTLFKALKQGFLRKDVLEILLKRRVLVDSNGSFYGLGVRIHQDQDIFYHSGSNCGYKTRYEFDLKNEKAVALMVSSDLASDITESNFMPLLLR